jgi:hypothetical protein
VKAYQASLLGRCATCTLDLGRAIRELHNTTTPPAAWAAANPGKPWPGPSTEDIVAGERLHRAEGPFAGDVIATCNVCEFEVAIAMERVTAMLDEMSAAGVFDYTVYITLGGKLLPMPMSDTDPDADDLNGVVILPATDGRYIGSAGEALAARAQPSDDNEA